MSKLIKMSKKTELPYFRDFHLNDPEGKIHKCIEDGDAETVKTLLNQGVKMCTAPGNNCFMVAQQKWGWQCVKKLLELDPDGVFVKNSNGETLLMIYSYNVEIIKELLVFGANPNARSNKNRKTVLMIALEHPNANFDAVESILNAGADPNMIVATMEPWDKPTTVLTCALQSKKGFTVRIIKLLFESVDFARNNYECEFLIHTCLTRFFKMLDTKCVKNQAYLKKYPYVETDEDRELIDVLQYLFENPYIQSQHHLYRPQLHPQNMIMSKWINYLSFDTPDFFFNSSLIIPQQIVTQNLVLPVLKYECEHIDFLPLTLFLKYMNSKFSDYNNLIKFLEKMLKLGYTLYHPDAISPIAMLLLKIKTESTLQTQFISEEDEDPDKDPDDKKTPSCEFLQLIQFLIDNGTHVGQIGFWEQNFSLDETYRILKQETHVPDAICSAVDSGNFTCLRLLMPYFGGPPLSLVLFPYPINEVNYNKLVLLLLEWGPLSPATPFTKIIKNVLEELRDDGYLTSNVYGHYLEMHRSPPKLTQLCRCVVRQCLSEKASQPGYNLPDLVLELGIPHGLRDFLMMTPSTPINVVYCENRDLVRSAYGIESDDDSDIYDTISTISSSSEDELDISEPKRLVANLFY